MNINYSKGKAPVGLESEYGTYIHLCPLLPARLLKMFFISLFSLPVFYSMDESKDDYTFLPLN